MPNVTNHQLCRLVSPSGNEMPTANGMALPTYSRHVAAPRHGCGMHRFSAGLSSAEASFPWLWPTFPLSVHLQTASKQRCQQAALKNVSHSSWDLVHGQNPRRFYRTLLEKTLLANEEHMYQSIRNFGNAILRNHTVKIRSKRNKISVVTIQFSSQPIQPPNLLLSRQYFLYYTVHKGEEKKLNKTKSDPLGCQFVPHFPCSAGYDFCVRVSLRLNSTAPSSQRAAGQEGKEKGRSFPFRMLLPKTVLGTHKNERMQKSRAQDVPHILAFCSAAQQCLLRLEIIQLGFLGSNQRVNAQ